eukprot:365922-Chlamydomonas_euryale.AAC.8
MSIQPSSDGPSGGSSPPRSSSAGATTSGADRTFRRASACAHMGGGPVTTSGRIVGKPFKAFQHSKHSSARRLA